MCILLQCLGCLLTESTWCSNGCHVRDRSQRRIDEGGIDGDLCAVLTAPGKSIVAVVWPTAEKLKVLKQFAEVSQARAIQWLQNLHFAKQDILCGERKY